MIIRVGMVVKHSFSGSHYTIKSISPECKCDGDAPHFHITAERGGKEVSLNRFRANGTHIFLKDYLTEISSGNGMHRDLFEGVAA